MFDVVAVGELLIDFTPVQSDVAGAICFAQHPGGAPANVAVTLARLGRRAAFIGKVGEDEFGRYLGDVLRRNNVDCRGLVQSKDVNTTLAFVHLDASGDRSFSFYRRPGADMMLSVQELDFDLIQSAKVFHFGAVSLTDEPARTATLKAAEYAFGRGALVTYDPNLRPVLWRSLHEAREVILRGLNYAHVLKISEEELLFLTKMEDLDLGSKYLADTYGLKLILVTMGEKGCFYRFHSEFGTVPGFSVDTVDTTGAGDAFFGGFLVAYLDSFEDVNGLEHASRTQIESMVRFANAVGALTTTGKGAISSIPSREALSTFLSRF